MKTKLLPFICLTILLAGCSKNVDESAFHNENTDSSQNIDIQNDNNTTEESIEASSGSTFPPVGIIAPITTTPSSVNEYESDEIVVDGYVESFYLDEVKYTESTWGSFGFVIKDDGNIVIDENWAADITDPDYKNEVIESLHELYSLEYVGLSHLNEHLFRYGDDLLAIANNPEGMENYPFFSDSDYDESRFYYAHIYEPYDFTDTSHKPTENVNESVPHYESTDAIHSNDIKGDDTTEESSDTSSKGVFPPEGITAPITTTPHSVKEYESGEEIPAGRKAESFYFEEVKYIESTWGVWTFVIEDDGNIVIEGEDGYEDNEVVKALRGLYSLEYVGLSYLNEHLFRCGDDLIAIAESPAEKKQSVYFKDSDYDESQFYYARIYEPCDLIDTEQSDNP